MHKCVTSPFYVSAEKSNEKQHIDHTLTVYVFDNDMRSYM